MGDDGTTSAKENAGIRQGEEENPGGGGNPYGSLI
jgi:hypothetical protein